MTPAPGPAAPGVSSPVAVFAALGDPTRQRLLAAVSAGEPSAADLAALLALTRQAVEKQLRVLEQAGLVRREQLGRRVRFAVRAETLSDTAVWLAALADTWDRRLAAVKTLAESSSTEPAPHSSVWTTPAPTPGDDDLSGSP